MGSLFVVATPIGNLGDISERALQTLRAVALIAAEDTRHTGKLLARYGIETPLVSYHAFNAKSREASLLQRLETGDVALVSDAGTPGISDPGMELVDAALEAGFAVHAIPGPSAITAAVSISGLIDGPFTFVGFLPRKSGERTALIARAASSGFGLVLFESPHRLAATMEALANACETRRFAVVRELTKIHEEVVRGRFGDAGTIERFLHARGEIVIVVEGGASHRDDLDSRTEIRRRLAAGEKPNAIARELAGLTGIPKSELYRLAIALGRSGLNHGEAED